MRKILFILLLSTALTANATQIYEVPKDLGILGKIINAVSYCKFSLPCYLESKFGATITTINASDKISDSRSVINTNFSNLNTDKMEVSTTSVDSITALDNLSSVGTITSGTFNGSVFGTSTPSQYLVLIGDGDNGVAVASTTGTSGQFLTSNGSGDYPSWQTPAVDVGTNYNWTGDHDFAGTVTLATTTTIGSGSAGGLTPPGSLMAYSTTTAPAGWLLADGTSYDTATYPDLYAVIGYSYGGSGSNFNVPNLSGRGILMASSTANIGQTGGESNHTMTESELVGHTHSFATRNASGSDDGEVSQGNAGAAEDGSKTTSSTGSGTPFNVLDPYIVLNYIIKY